MRTGRLHKLNHLQIKNAPASGPGSVLSDGGGLYLRCALWIFRFTSPVTGKERDLSLGSVDALTLKTARSIAAGNRELVAQGIDPFTQRQTERVEAKERALKARTFGDVAAEWIATKLPERRGTRNPTSLAKALKRYSKPLAALPMASITSIDIAHALKVLADRPSMRDTLVSLIHTVFDWAMAADIIPEALNPARKRKLGKLLPKRSVQVTHNRFLSAAELPRFMTRLEQIPGALARAFELLVHTGLRQAEVARLEWDWVDLETRIITFPVSAMKAGKAHRVYLSDRALAIVIAMLPERKPNGCVFPGRGSRMLGERSFRTFLQDRFPEYAHLQVHGTRGSLKTWATASLRHSREVVETALAHRIGGKVEMSYFDAEAPEIWAARIELYRDWSAFLTSAGPQPETSPDNVMALRDAA
jgi:integrase